MNSPHITVGLVDDQQLVRAGFSLVLDSQDDIEVLWQAEQGQQACELATQQPVDIMLMDVQMPVMDGIAATRKILDAAPVGPGGEVTKIIVLTTFDNDSYVLKSVEAGASGFLLKDAEPEDLLSAVRTVGESASVISPKSTARLLRHVREMGTGEEFDGAASTEGMDGECVCDKGANRECASEDGTQGNSDASADFGLVEPLTPRELEILRLMAKGKSNQEISTELFISLPTVKTHVGKVLLKTNSRDRVHAVLFAFRNGVVDPEDLLGDVGDHP
ncbi:MULTISPECIES: response regulator transcription factor [Corynebacterium]|uniref:response regulator transcription factor n=1 Tax=Corynebacterium TaxID=1716 RepID=UPI001883690D|nr:MULTISPECIES: response regulator transcription factor [Corynebacterium]MBF0581294.1 response regulator transcription factor [Corynebacterium sp. ED61]